MEMVALMPGSGRTVGVPLPVLDPARAPLLDTGDDMSPDDLADDPICRLTSAVAQADRLATVTAAFRDELMATAYREGAAEYAARLTHLPPAERREWGARAMLAELACALRIPEGTLARRLARQAALAALPRFREANLTGLISSWHCDVMLDIFGHVSDEAALAAADEALIGKALELTPSELRVPARRWRARHVPKTDEERQRNLADRHVAIAPADDDLCWLTALLPAAQAMAIYHRLSDVAASASGPDEPRTLDQLRADAMCDLLLGDVSTTSDVGDGLGGIVPTVVVTVPVLSLLGHSDEPAEVEGFGPIDIETAKRLAAQAPSFIRVLTHPETGAVLSVGRERYRVPADLRTALVIRDETCRFPGCRRRAMRCDVDHADAWYDDDGCTEIDNLEHLCRKHHRLKHEAGWQLEHHGGGRITWTSPVGRRYESAPSREVRSGAPPGRRKEPRAQISSDAASPGRRNGTRPEEPRAQISSDAGPPARGSAFPDEPPF